MSNESNYRFTNEELNEFLSQPGNYEVIRDMLVRQRNLEAEVPDPDDQQFSIQEVPQLEEAVEEGIEPEAMEVLAIERKKVQEVEPQADTSLQNPDVVTSSPGTGKAPADASEIRHCHDVTASTGRVPRDQGDQPEQSFESRKSFASNITQMSAVISIMNWISERWTSMLEYWNGLGVLPREVVHILQVIGVRKVLEIRIHQVKVRMNSGE